MQWKMVILGALIVLTAACGGGVGISVPSYSAGPIFVVDRDNHRIVRVNDMTGAGWTTFGSMGSGTNQFHHLSGIFVR
jgi:hypothetical protein